MAIGHMDIRAHSRRKRHSVAAAFAYRLGCALVDSRTATLHDYSRRGTRAEVVAGGFACGRTPPAWGLTAQAFADALETGEKRWDAMVCRDVSTALPHELDHEQRIELATEWAEFLATKYNAPVPWAVHRPDARSDRRNWHIHSLLPTRTLDEATGELGAKLRQFHVRARDKDKDRETKRDDSGGANEIRELRREWERRCNQALAAAGIDARISMGRLDDPSMAAPVLSRGEVEAERWAWRERHPRTRQPAMSVSQLITENASADGGCATERGRQLAQYLANRSILTHMDGPGARAQPAGGSLPAADEQRQDIESAAATAETIQPVDAPAATPAPERTRSRRPRRRRRAVRAVEVPAAPAAQRPPERRPAARSAVARADASQLPAPTPIPVPERARSTCSAVCAAEPPALPTATPIPLPERRIEVHSAVAAVDLPPPAPQRPPERRPAARSAVARADASQLPVPTPIPVPERARSTRSAVCAAEPPALPTAMPIPLPERRIEAHSTVAAVDLPPPAPQRPPERRPAARSAVARADPRLLPVPTPPPRPLQRRSNARGIVRTAETVRIPVPTTITRRLVEIVRALRDLAAQRARFLSTPKSAAKQEDEPMNSASEIERVRRRRAGIVHAHAVTHGVAPAQDELSQAREWLTDRKNPGQHGISIPDVADSIARQRLTGNPVLSEFHPHRYSKRPPLPTAISELAPQAAPGFPGNRFGPIPDGWNTGACRTRDGAEQAAKELEREIDDIARQHFDGHTDPRDYKPSWLKPSVEKAKNAAMQAWQAIRDTVIDRMVTAAAGPEAIEIRRRRRQENIDKKARERAAQERRAQIATAASQPIKPDHGQDRWD